MVNAFSSAAACKGQNSPMTDVRIVTSSSTQSLQFFSPIPGVGWTTVCANNPYRSHWDLIMEVVCNTLGYDSDIANISYSCKASLRNVENNYYVNIAVSYLWYTRGNNYRYAMSCPGRSSVIADCDPTIYSSSYCYYGVTGVSCPLCELHKTLATEKPL